MTNSRRPAHQGLAWRGAAGGCPVAGYAGMVCRITCSSDNRSAVVKK